MKFAISSEHRDFFSKQRAIEFEQLLTEEQVNQLRAAVESTVAERLTLPLNDIDQVTPGKLFLAGRDLWRDNTAIQKIIKQKALADIAVELMEEPANLRLGYDQFFPEFRGRVYKTVISDAYHEFLARQASLSAVSSFDNVACGLMLCLSGSDPQAAPNGSIFSNQAGNGIFIHPEALIDFKELTQHPMHKYLLVVYVRKNAAYKRNDIDPHTHALKQFDYMFGEKLKDKWHPQIVR